jgi:hypothetical protein
MKRDQFIRELNREAHRTGRVLEVDYARGKGGHCVVRLDGGFSVVRSGEITPIMARVIRKQLGLE